MEIWNKTEERLVQKMEKNDFPRSVITTAIWAARTALNREEAYQIIEALLDKEAMPREIVKAVQPLIQESLERENEQI